MKACCQSPSARPRAHRNDLLRLPSPRRSQLLDQRSSRLSGCGDSKTRRASVALKANLSCSTSCTRTASSVRTGVFRGKFFAASMAMNWPGLFSKRKIRKSLCAPANRCRRSRSSAVRREQRGCDRRIRRPHDCWNREAAHSCRGAVKNPAWLRNSKATQRALPWHLPTPLP